MSLSAGSLVLDAEALYRELLRGVRSLMGPNTQLAGVASGGAWLVERLHKDLGLAGKPGVLASVIPYSADVERMGVFRQPLGAALPGSMAAKAYESLWHEILDRVAA